MMRLWNNILLRPSLRRKLLMTVETIAHPPIASYEEWLAARKALLAREKEVTRARDAVSAARRRLPMVRIAKEYTFASPDGPVSLLDLFDGRRQLIVYHFMFDPRWERGCMGCTGFVNDLGDLGPLAERDTRFVLVSRAPLEKLEQYKALNGWSVPWYSSYDSDFNYDFHVTFDASVTPIMHNYRDAAELEQLGIDIAAEQPSESHGISVFFRVEDEVFHTYSAYARGAEGLTDVYSLLDITPYGRQEDWEDSPSGWPQRPTYG
jgi:predicted dithiol-disulfide oxidoreductase (DUF899 family)